jgi:hypothetical protein
MKRIVRLTESDLARIVRRVISEEMEQESGLDGWSKIVTSLQNTNPKLIKMKDGDQSLNWYGHRPKWNIAISKNGSFLFTIYGDLEKLELIQKLCKMKGFPVEMSSTKNFLYTSDYTTFPTDKLTSLIKEIINNLKK